MNAAATGPYSRSEKGNVRTGFDLKGVHSALRDFTDDELKQIPVMPERARLEEGATYLDRGADPVPTEITAQGVIEAWEGHRYVAKTGVDYDLPRRVTDPERTRPVAMNEGHCQQVVNWPPSIVDPSRSCTMPPS